MFRIQIIEGFDMGSPVVPVDKTGKPFEAGNPLHVTMTGGGGGGGTGGEVTVTNWPATQPVSGTVSVTGVATSANQSTQTTVLNTISTILGELNTDFGMPAEPAWSGTGNGTVIAILKAIHAQNASMIALLGEIRDNTASV